MALGLYGIRKCRLLPGIFWRWTALSYLAVIYWQAIPGAWELLIQDLLFTRYAPLFISGMMIYRWHRYGTPCPADRALLVFAMGHALVAYEAPFSYFVLGCYGVFILAVAGFLNGLAVRPLLLLGNLSYALYLVHQNIGYGLIEWSYSQGLPGGVGVTLAVAAALLLDGHTLSG